jgi:hypothetical protein
MAGAKHGMTDSELASLTEEERAGVLEEDEDESEEEELEEQPEKQTEKQPEEPPKQTEEGKQPGEEKKAEEEPGRDDGEPVDSRPAPVPLIKGDLPADFNDRVTALNEREDALVEKFEEGDLTTKEYNAELRKINKERGDLEWLARKAELSQEASKGEAERDWYGEVDAFLKDHPEIMLNQTRTSSYDAIVREVTSATMKAGGTPGRADLEKAHKQWANDLGITVAADPGRKPQKGPKNVPPTLANAPAADITETEDGKFAQLDRLAETDPLAYERAISKMTSTSRSIRRMRPSGRRH